MENNMAKQTTFLRGPGVLNLISDKDWVTIITALLSIKNKENQNLAKLLLARTKHGRQIRLMRMIKQQRPRLSQMQKAMKVTRRTIFRDLNCLEDYGVKLLIDENYRYEIARLPKQYKRLV